MQTIVSAEGKGETLSVGIINSSAIDLNWVRISPN